MNLTADEVITQFADFMNKLKPEQRTSAIEQLHEETNFCWECGYVEDKDRPCQCWNDE